MSDGSQGLVPAPLARRGFIMTSLIVGFSLATEQVEAQVIHTDSDGLVAEEMQVPVADGVLPGYFARPTGAGPFPTVIVVEEVFGLHEYIKDTCRRLAKLGYMAVAVELYARLGDLAKMTDMKEVMGVINRAPDATTMTDLDSLAAWAFANGGDPSRLGITGFCWGGRAVWLYAAHNPALKAAVSWYGLVGGNRTDIQPQTVADMARDIRCPLLGLYGVTDPLNPPAAVEAAAAKARAGGEPVEIILYPGVGHAFHADYRPSYVRDAAMDGWGKMQAWFHRYGVA